MSILTITKINGINVTSSLKCGEISNSKGDWTSTYGIKNSTMSRKSLSSVEKSRNQFSMKTGTGSFPTVIVESGLNNDSSPDSSKQRISCDDIEEIPTCPNYSDSDPETDYPFMISVEGKMDEWKIQNLTGQYQVSLTKRLSVG